MQRVADALVVEGLCVIAPNSAHKRASFLLLSDSGKQAFAAMIDRQVPWANRLADGLSADEFRQAERVLQILAERLNQP